MCISKKPIKNPKPNHKIQPSILKPYLNMCISKRPIKNPKPNLKIQP